MTDVADVPVRDAATVVLLRDGAAGIEVWMLVRAPQLVFAAGMAVFPGGRVDAGDAELPMLAGDSVAETARGFGCDEHLARALLGAALRETFEETGVLLAVPPADLARHRTAVEAGHQPFGGLLERYGVRLDPSALRPWARWVTPAGETRRYDTRFFVAFVPEGVEPADVTTESSSAAWIGVGDAIEQAHRGQRILLPPTLVTLTELSAYSQVADVLRAAGQRRIDAVRPDVEAHPDGTLSAVLPDGSRLSLPRLDRP